MKTLARALLIALLLPLAAHAREADAIARLRELYRLMDEHTLVAEGRTLILRDPSSTELRAWYIAGLANIDADEAMAMATQLRHAHPQDPWSWFAMAAAELGTTTDYHLAPKSSEKMLALYEGADPEVFRLHAYILRALGRYDDLEQYLANKSGTWVEAEKAMILDARSWSDPSLFDAGQAALTAAEAADPSDVRLLAEHARVLAKRRRKDEAIPLFRRAIELSPDALSIRREYWRTFGKEQQEAATAEIEAFLARHAYPAALSLARQTYRAVGLEEKSEALKQKLLTEFPESSQAEAVLFSSAMELARAQGRERTPEATAEAVKLWRAFIDYPFHGADGGLLGEAYQYLFYALKDDGAPEEFLDVVDGWLAFGETNEIAGRIAEALATRGLRLEQAEKLARIGVRDALVKLDRDAGFYPKEQYAKSAESLKGNANAILGWVLLQRKQSEEAGKLLRNAVKQSPLNATAYRYLGKWYEAHDQLTKADETYTTGMTHERGPDTANADALRALYVKRHGSDEGWPAYFAAAKEGTASKAKRQILGSRIVPARALRKPFALPTLAGDEVSFDSLRGRVVLVKFWGVWCGPCVSEMPDFQKLVDKYADDPRVAIVTIDSDSDPDKPRSFMEKNKYRFPVLLDDGWINSSAGINSFPTAWFIGPDGKIAFEKKGVSGDLVSEYSWRIEALK